LIVVFDAGLSIEAVGAWFAGPVLNLTKLATEGTPAEFRMNSM
jgi:hypothetical protein